MAERRIKTIDELTLMDDYMFAQVFREQKHLKPLLEFILRIRISRIEFIEPQKTEKEGYDSHGVRLDLYVTDEEGRIYNVEVQTTSLQNLPKRMRYYQSVIDISILQPSVDYSTLRKTYVIFICNYDPFGRKRYIYSFENVCREEPDLRFGDETVKVIVNTKGEIGEISDELKEALEYMDSGTVTGEYSKELDAAVTAVKTSEERRVEYMTMAIREMEIRAESRAEGLEEGLEKGMEKGREEGLAEGMEKKELSTIQLIMEKLKMKAEDAMDFLNIAKEDQARYTLLLREKADSESAYKT